MLEFEYDKSNNSYIISDDISFVYGVGNSWADAFRDYILSLIEYVQLLRKRHDYG